MTIPFTQQQFAACLPALKAQKGVTVTLGQDGQTGSVTTPKADFTFGFNGSALTVTVTAKHGMAKMVSDDVVYAHIHDDLLAVKG